MRSQAEKIKVDWEEVDRLETKLKSQEQLVAQEREALVQCLGLLKGLMLNMAEAKQPAAKKQRGRKKPGGGRQGRNSADDLEGADREWVPHETWSPGDCCPCGRGRFYQLEPGKFIHFTGQVPLQATVYQQQRLRCAACNKVTTAATPEHTKGQKYDARAKATIAIMKYGLCLPLYRLAKFQKWLGMPLACSVQYKLIQDVALAIEPVYQHMVKQAASARLFYIDDSHFPVLSLMAENKENPDLKRTGMRTTSVIAEIEGHTICVFLTGRAHAGENIGNLLASRPEQIPKAIQMSDALAANLIHRDKVIVAFCMAHALRKFMAVEDMFPRECGRIIEDLVAVYDLDDQTVALTDQQRLAYHQRHSQPILNDLSVWMKKELEDKRVEENSALGKEIKYTLKHWDGLTQFLVTAGAPLDNNICERMVKLIVLLRKNSLFFKTEQGAAVGSKLMSLIKTCTHSGVNPFNYLVALQEHDQEAERDPGRWMPWNWRDNLEQVNQMDEPSSRARGPT